MRAALAEAAAAPERRPPLRSISGGATPSRRSGRSPQKRGRPSSPPRPEPPEAARSRPEVATSSERSEEHTSELQSRENLVCRLLLEKKKTKYIIAGKNKTCHN